jgi:hypothetical protein
MIAPEVRSTPACIAIDYRGIPSTHPAVLSTRETEVPDMQTPLTPRVAIRDQHPKGVREGEDTGTLLPPTGSKEKVSVGVARKERYVLLNPFPTREVTRLATFTLKPVGP